jgi:hypothetical protein
MRHIERMLHYCRSRLASFDAEAPVQRLVLLPSSACCDDDEAEVTQIFMLRHIYDSFYDEIDNKMPIIFLNTIAFIPIWKSVQTFNTFLWGGSWCSFIFSSA